MNECIAPILEPPAAWAAVDARHAESNAGELPAVLSREAVTSFWDYARFAVEQQGVYCQLV
jgi:hypothetical protein